MAKIDWKTLFLRERFLNLIKENVKFFRTSEKNMWATFHLGLL